MLYRSELEIQLALPELPSQMGSAFLVLLKAAAGKVQVVVALHLHQSCCNYFYLSDAGEVALEQASQELEAGRVFAESMGFVLHDIEFTRLAADKLEHYWKSLAICQTHAETAAPAAAGPELKKAPSAQNPLPPKVPGEPSELAEKRQFLKEQLGQLFASL
jgi:hypothetical protein